MNRLVWLCSPLNNVRGQRTQGMSICHMLGSPRNSKDEQAGVPIVSIPTEGGEGSWKGSGEKLSGHVLPT